MCFAKGVQAGFGGEELAAVIKILRAGVSSMNRLIACITAASLCPSLANGQAGACDLVIAGAGPGIKPE